MSELIKTLNLIIVETQYNTASHLACEKFTANTRLLPCYLKPPHEQIISCRNCAFHSAIEAKPIVKILSKFHE